MQAELKILTFTGNDRCHSGVAKKSETMTDASETLQFKIKAILNDISQLDDAQIQVGAEIDLYRLKLGGVHGANQNGSSIDKQARALENRLEKAKFL